MSKILMSHIIAFPCNHFFHSTIRTFNISMFFVEATIACLSTCIKLCARLCICIEPVALLPTGVVCQNFPREFHRYMRHELSFRFVPLYEPVRGRIFLGRDGVAGNFSLFFCLFQYLPLSGFHKNSGFCSSKGAKGSPGIDVCIGRHRPFLYFTLLSSLMCRERNGQTKANVGRIQTSE